MKKTFTAFFIIALLTFMLFGCSKGTAPQTAELATDLDVPSVDLDIPQENISAELMSSDEPDFGLVS